jgi:hypothetical protein
MEGVREAQGSARGSAVREHARVVNLMVFRFRRKREYGGFEVGWGGCVGYSSWSVVELVLLW